MYALLIDGATGAFSNREQVIDQIDQMLDDDPWPTAATWGTSARAVAGQRAMMSLFPAPPMPAGEQQLDDHRRGVRRSTP